VYEEEGERVLKWLKGCEEGKYPKMDFKLKVALWIVAGIMVAGVVFMLYLDKFFDGWH